MDEILDRREVLARVARLVLIVPVGALAARCGGGSDGGMDRPTNGFTVTSSTASGHAHGLFVPFDLVERPASVAESLTTEAGSTYGIGSHTHVVTLSVDELTSIMHGGVVEVTSALSAGHAHSFSIRLP